MTPPYSLQGEALQQTGINLKNSFVIPAQTQCNQALWSLEKALQSKECSMVLAWQNWLSARVLRRLELAAQHGNTLGVVFHQRPQPRSSTSLQLQIQVLNDRISGRRALEVTVLQAAGQTLGSKHRLMLS
jgi:cell division inhibitor SulA